MKKEYDNVYRPKHYNAHPSGVECIKVSEHFNFCLGNALKYIWRADLKNGLEDLEKAVWYIEREIFRRSSALTDQSTKAASPTKTPIKKNAKAIPMPLKNAARLAAKSLPRK